jgi:hypothetical protein
MPMGKKKGRTNMIGFGGRRTQDAGRRRIRDNFGLLEAS